MRHSASLDPRVLRTENLNACEREPVHTPGSIQPHGVLVVVDRASLLVVAASENAERLLGVTPEALLGQPAASLAAEEMRPAWAQSLRGQDLEERNPLALRTASGAVLSVTAHEHDGRIVLECEAEDAARELPRVGLHHRVRAALVRLRSTTSLRELCETTAREIRALTGFDRVLVYAFQPDWSGEVYAEDCVDGHARYRGLRFPASDIPSQARALYSVCRVRAVPTSRYVPARMIASQGSLPLDLTHAHLRSVSPVHLEYMRNMGVTASLGLSLMDGERLWGLITCNHESGERALPHDVRIACSLVAELVSSLIGKRQAVDVAEARAAFLRTEAQLVRYVVQDADLVRGLTQHSPTVLDVTRSSGAAVHCRGEVHGIGKTPPREEIASLVAWLDERGDETVCEESLSAVYPPAVAWRDVACGLVASRISLSDSAVVRGKIWLLWFRPEVVQSVSWGGDPTKKANPGEGDRLSPRTSFDLWREEVHLKSAPFLPSEIAAARSLASALVDVVLEIEASRRIKENAELLRAANARLVAQMEENQRVTSALQLVLDATADGLVSAGRDGRLLSERSTGFTRHFGEAKEGDFIWDVLFPDDRAAAEELALMWQQTTSERVPFAVGVDQMCSELTHRGRTFSVEYRDVRENGRLSRILVTLSDVTERAAARRSARDAAEAEALLSRVLRDARGFGLALGELGSLLESVSTAASPRVRSRALHTLKGSAAVLGLTTLAERCHALEDLVAARGDGDPPTASELGEVEEELSRIRSRVREVVGQDAAERIEVPVAEVEAAISAISAIEGGALGVEAAGNLRRWLCEPAGRALGKLAARARRVGWECGKDVDVVVVPSELRLDPARFAPLWAALGHAVTNAIEHGIEDEGDRSLRGKPDRGRVTLSAEGDGSGGVVILVEDDGAGIDLEAVRRVAQRRGLPCERREDLLAAVFADALTTRATVTSTAGRGVGLAALREACERLGGRAEVETDAGIGTRVRVRIPGR